MEDIYRQRYRQLSALFHTWSVDACHKKCGQVNCTPMLPALSLKLHYKFSFPHRQPLIKSNPFSPSPYPSHHHTATSLRTFAPTHSPPQSTPHYFVSTRPALKLPPSPTVVLWHHCYPTFLIDTPSLRRRSFLFNPKLSASPPRCSNSLLPSSFHLHPPRRKPPLFCYGRQTRTQLSDPTTSVNIRLSPPLSYLPHLFEFTNP